MFQAKRVLEVIMCTVTGTLTMGVCVSFNCSSRPYSPVKVTLATGLLALLVM